MKTIGGDNLLSENKSGRLDAFPMVLVVGIRFWATPTGFTNFKADGGTPTRFPRSEEFITHTQRGAFMLDEFSTKSIVSFLNR